MTLQLHCLKQQDEQQQLEGGVACGLPAATAAAVADSGSGNGGGNGNQSGNHSGNHSGNYFGNDNKESLSATDGPLKGKGSGDGGGDGRVSYGYPVMGGKRRHPPVDVDEGWYFAAVSQGEGDRVADRGSRGGHAPAVEGGGGGGGEGGGGGVGGGGAGRGSGSVCEMLGMVARDHAALGDLFEDGLKVCRMVLPFELKCGCRASVAELADKFLLRVLFVWLCLVCTELKWLIRIS